MIFLFASDFLFEFRFKYVDLSKSLFNRALIENLVHINGVLFRVATERY